MASKVRGRGQADWEVWVNQSESDQAALTCCCVLGANPYLTFHCANQGTILIDLAPDDKEYQSVEEEVGPAHRQTVGHVIGLFVSPLCVFALQMQSTIREHRDGGNAGGVFSRYNIIKVRNLVLMVGAGRRARSTCDTL